MKRHVLEHRIAAQHVPDPAVGVVLGVVKAELLLALARAVGIGRPIEGVARAVQDIAGQDIRHDGQPVLGDIAQALGQIAGRWRHGQGGGKAHAGAFRWAIWSSR